MSALRELAAKATKGPCRADKHSTFVWCRSDKGGERPLVQARGWGYLTGKGHGALGLSEDEAIARQQADLNYIAACSPEVITALLDVADAARALARHSVLDTAGRAKIYCNLDDALARLDAMQKETQDAERQ